MDRASDLDFFALLARHPSLAAAAQELGLSPPAVSRRLAQLETRLGADAVTSEKVERLSHALDEQKRAMRELDHVLNPKVQGKLIYLYGDYRREIICYAETAPQYKAGASWPASRSSACSTNAGIRGLRASTPAARWVKAMCAPACRKPKAGCRSSRAM